MYKLPYSTDTYGNICSSNFIVRLSDNACIPFDPDNSDYAAYLKWLEAGNVPEPADEVSDA
jgi:hypothetical protein